MTDSATEVGHCKDVNHVRVLPITEPMPGPKEVFGAVFVPTTTCVNVPGYDGWVVQLTMQTLPHPVRPGLRLLPGLAEVMPTWLRRAARSAAGMGMWVVIEHTDDKLWKPYAYMSPADARALAVQVLDAVAEAPSDWQ